jgi:hypothetical protein
MAKTNTDLEKLIAQAKRAIDCYEEYLLDKKDWKDLAKTMTCLRDTIEDIEVKKYGNT